jgi:hypothetical protein
LLRKKTGLFVERILMSNLKCNDEAIEGIEKATGID